MVGVQTKSWHNVRCVPMPNGDVANARNNTSAAACCASKWFALAAVRCGTVTQQVLHLSAQNIANCVPSRLTSRLAAVVFAFASAYRSVSSLLSKDTASAGKAWLLASQYSMTPAG